jgi:hypothetical protein
LALLWVFSVTFLDPKRVLTTVGFQALQFNTGKKQFVAARNVPFPDSQTIEMPARDRPLNPPCDARRIPGGVP